MACYGSVVETRAQTELFQNLIKGQTQIRPVGISILRGRVYKNIQSCRLIL